MPCRGKHAFRTSSVLPSFMSATTFPDNQESMLGRADGKKIRKEGWVSKKDDSQKWQEILRAYSLRFAWKD